MSRFTKTQLYSLPASVMGMSQVWFVGPIGSLIGEPPFGGDIGFPLAFGFSAISYAFFRYFEKKRFGR
jgi:purine-cytosine permease-like protein